jgi:hypothetical protein
MDCRYCGEYLAGDPDKIGARCPRCREPLYEKNESTRLRNEASRANGGTCAVHAHSPAAANCQRCGAAVCPVCRSRWLDEVMCTACLEKALAVKHQRPEEALAHRRQAVLGLGLGAAAWVVMLIAGIPLLGLRGHESDTSLAITAGVIALISLLPSLFGLGQAAAAVRVRGDRLRMATWGLCVCGAHLGAVLGLLLFAVWNR